MTEADFPGILVDSSVWIQYFRDSKSSVAEHLGYLIEIQEVVSCAPIKTEILSGARSEHERSFLKDLFIAVKPLELPDDVWDKIEESRFRLARKGKRASLIDLMIACVSERYQAPFWTLDQDFLVIRDVIKFPRYIPDKV